MDRKLKTKNNQSNTNVFLQKRLGLLARRRSPVLLLLLPLERRNQIVGKDTEKMGV
jgi:hypothetical protein